MSDLGFIDAVAAAALSVQPGPIRLLQGFGGAKGFGALHIETNTSRMKQLAGLGYPTAISFVGEVARNWTRAAHGENGRLILLYTKATYDLRIVVQFTPGPDPFWSVVTGIPARVWRDPVAYEKSALSPVADNDAGEGGNTVGGSEPPQAPPKALPH